MAATTTSFRVAPAYHRLDERSAARVLILHAARDLVARPGDQDASRFAVEKINLDLYQHLNSAALGYHLLGVSCVWDPVMTGRNTTRAARFNRLDPSHFVIYAVVSVWGWDLDVQVYGNVLLPFPASVVLRRDAMVRRSVSVKSKVSFCPLRMNTKNGEINERHV